MLTSADRELVARDPALPGLALLLDSSALLDFLRHRYPHLVLDTLSSTYLRYKPGTSCVAGFSLSVNGVPTWLTFTARPKDAADKLAKVTNKQGIDGPFGPGRVVFPEIAISMACFPNDPQLKRLWRITSAEAQAPLLARLGLPRDATIIPLRYRPGRRFVAQVRQQDRPIAVLKLHSAESYTRALGAAQIFASSGALKVPDFLSCSDRYGAVVSSWVSGVAARATPETAHQIGWALASLHRQPATGLRRLSLAEQQASARFLAADIAALRPCLGKRAVLLAEAIATALDSDAAPVALHGDCHLEQFLLRGTDTICVDFDEAASGPAAWDLGNLLAHLVADGLPQVESIAFRDALVDGYRAQGGSITPHDLDAQMALGLLRLATRPFRERCADWPAAIASILTLAENLCPVPSNNLTGAAILQGCPEDPAIPHIAAALEPDEVNRALVEAGCSARVEAAQLVRHKPGRRCLISYVLRDQDGRSFAAYGKIRAKGADSRSFAVQQELWNSGFGPDGQSGAYVAEPLALLPHLGMWVQAKVPGKAFSTLTCDAGQAARAISALHKSGVRPLRRHLVADELAILDERLTMLVDRRPEWASQIADIRHAANERAAHLLPIAPGPIHRDFYHDHLLSNGTDHYLIDLDLLCLGDPALDIGNFNAHLTEWALREWNDPEKFADWQRQFTRNACRENPVTRPENIAVYEFLSLVRLLEISDRMPERRASAPALLELCLAHVQTLPLYRRSPK
ncbi:aminoglycoside phosphotransferase family protein [Sphingorhabdus lacus]|nr:aminoglycoside phosphotransferase family protein [Sphingorhabdus lacus]